MPQDLRPLHKFPIQTAEWRVAGLARVPIWVNDDHGKPMRPWLAICTGPTAGVDISKFTHAGAQDFAKVIDALIAQAHRLKTLPEILHVWDPALAVYLQEHFRAADLAIRVEVHDKHPIVDALISDLAAPMIEDSPLQGMLSGKDVTIERIAAFAAAAADFYRAAPWKLFCSDEDLLKIESPKMPPGMTYAVVLGSGNQEFGIGFYRSPKDFQEMRTALDPADYFGSRSYTTMSFAELHEIPIEDADLWEDHKLPLFEGHAPLSAIVTPKTAKRLDARQLSRVEGLLCALAATTADDIQAGKWSRPIGTADGQVFYTLSLAKLPADPFKSMAKMRMEMERIFRDMQESGELRDLPRGKALSPSGIMKRGKRQTARTANPRSQAIDLTDDAWDAPRREATRLARESLTLWPDHADAYNILARYESDPVTAASLYRQGVAAGVRALGPKAFEELAGRFWGFHETRPYMRSLHGLAESLWAADSREEAIRVGQDMLRLNPNDNQGVRYELVCWLLIEQRNRDAAALLNQYKDDSSPWWRYAEALLAFRLGGDCPGARKNLAQAIESNRHLPPYLAGAKEVVVAPPHYSPGELSEALCCAEDLAPAWQCDPAAVAWLKGHSIGK